jgi:hypothetical protein
MDSTQAWRACFEQWPATVKRRGVLVTSFGDQIPFADFTTSAALLLIHRAAPDPVGARMVLVPYGTIMALKIIDPLPKNALAALGFADAAPASS